MINYNSVKSIVQCFPKWSRQPLVQSQNCTICCENDSQSSLSVSKNLLRDELYERAIKLETDGKTRFTGVMVNPRDKDGEVRQFKNLLVVIDHEHNPFRPAQISRIFGENLAVPSAMKDRQSIKLKLVLYHDAKTYVWIDLGEEVKNKSDFRKIERRLYDYLDGLFFDQTVYQPLLGIDPREKSIKVRVNRQLSGIKGIIPLFSRDTEFPRCTIYPEILKGHRYYLGHGLLTNYQILERSLARYFDEHTDKVIRETVTTIMKHRKYGVQAETESESSAMQAFGNMEWSI